MPKDDINYRFKEPSDTSGLQVPGIVYDFYDVFVPAELFRRPSLWVWGRNISGELGNNTITSRSTPITTFTGETNWKSVSAGRFHTVALKTDGSLWIWGNNDNGGLGINNTANKSTPVTTFLGGNNWKYISSGRRHTIAIKTDGTLWTWGRNLEGQLGINDIIIRSTPVTTFLGGSNWKSIACNGYSTTAIKTNGTLWTWGRGLSGELGDNATVNRNTPVTTFAGGTNWKSVAGGGLYHTTAIKSDGTLWTWGANNTFSLVLVGQLGTNDGISRSTPVTTFAGGSNWKQASCGSYCTVAIKTDGTLWTWGSSNDSPGTTVTAQLATNDTINRSTPVTTFAGGNNWKSISCGGYHATAIKTNGTLWTWGYGVNGSIGDNTTTTKRTPVTTIAGGFNWKSSSAGYHTIAIEYEPDP